MAGDRADRLGARRRCTPGTPTGRSRSCIIRPRIGQAWASTSSASPTRSRASMPRPRARLIDRPPAPARRGSARRSYSVTSWPGVRGTPPAASRRGRRRRCRRQPPAPIPRNSTALSPSSRRSTSPGKAHARMTCRRAPRPAGTGSRAEQHGRRAHHVDEVAQRPLVVDRRVDLEAVEVGARRGARLGRARARGGATVLQPAEQERERPAAVGEADAQVGGSRSKAPPRIIRLSDSWVSAGMATVQREHPVFQPATAEHVPRVHEDGGARARRSGRGT